MNETEILESNKVMLDNLDEYSVGAIASQSIINHHFCSSIAEDELIEKHGNMDGWQDAQWNELEARQEELSIETRTSELLELDL